MRSIFTSLMATIIVCLIFIFIWAFWYFCLGLFVLGEARTWVSLIFAFAAFVAFCIISASDNK